MTTGTGVSFGDLGWPAYLGAIAWLVLPVLLLSSTLRKRNSLVGRSAYAVMILVELAFYGVLAGAFSGSALPTRLEVLLLYGPLTLLLCGLARAVEWAMAGVDGRLRSLARRPRPAEPIPATVAAPINTVSVAAVTGGGIAGTASARSGEPAVEVLVGEIVDERSHPPRTAGPDPAEQAYASAIALGRPVRRLSNHLSMLATCSILLCYYVFVAFLGPRFLGGPNDPSLVLPLPAELSLRAEYRSCAEIAGGQSCTYLIQLAAPAQMSAKDLDDVLLAHLRSRGWVDNGLGQFCQRPGWFLHQQTCLSIETSEHPGSTGTTAIITLGIGH